VPVDGRSICQTTRGPRGVVGAIVGWNFPLVLAILKAAPALATGNCMVLKPSELSSLSALRLAELALEAGRSSRRIQCRDRHRPDRRRCPGAPPGHRYAFLYRVHSDGTPTAGRHGAKQHEAPSSGMRRQVPNIVFDDCPDWMRSLPRSRRGCIGTRARCAPPGPGCWCRNQSRARSSSASSGSRGLSYPVILLIRRRAVDR